jgi:tetrahydromethanopterin S-methyltransferase subunit G
MEFYPGGGVLADKTQWYDNKELYEMMVALSKGLEQTNAELAKTQVLIRDYNGLRERLDKCERRLDQGEGQKTGSKDMWGYIVGGIGLLFAILSRVT